MKSLDELAGVERKNRAGEFVQLARYLLLGQGRLTESVELAETSWATPRVRNVLKAAVAVAGTDNLGELADYRLLAESFIDSLQFIGVFDRLLAGGMRRIPLTDSRVRIISATLDGSVSSEAVARPISILDVGSSELDRRRGDAILVVTDDLLRLTGPAAFDLLQRELQNAAVAAVDRDFLSTTYLAAPTPIPSAGATAAHVRTDLANALGAMSGGSVSRYYLVVSSATAKGLSMKATTTGAAAFPDVTPQGGRIGGMPILVSDFVPASGSPPTASAMVVDSSGLVGNAEPVILDEARHATVKLSDDPDNDGAAPTISLWQTNHRALRASRYFGYKVIREDAVQVISGVTW